MREHYPIPTFEQIRKLIGSTIFSTLDPNKGCWQIALSKNASKLTPIVTPFGRNKFLRLPFGLSALSEVFQCTFSKLFDDIEVVKVYIDYVIYAKYKNEHDAIVEKVCKRANNFGIRIIPIKCKIAKNKAK